MRVGVVISTISREEATGTITALMGQPWDGLFLVRDYGGNVAKSRNRGWRAIADFCDVIAFTDDDCIPDFNFIEEGRKFFEDNWIDFMQGKVTGGIETSKDFFFITANFWAKVSALKNIGGFDEEYLYAGDEDLDFGWSIEKEGSKVSYNPKCIVTHVTKPKHRVLAHNQARLMKKFPERLTKLFRENTAR